MLRTILLAALLLFGAVAYAADEVPPDVAAAKQDAAAALNRLAAVSQKAGISTAPITVQAATQDNWSSARDWLRTVLVPAAISVGLYLMRIHTKIMQQAAMNGQVTTSAYGFGALFAQHVLANGGSAADLNVRNKDLATYVDLLLSNYPEYAKKLGLTADKASVLVLKGAAATVTSVTPLPTKSNKSPEQIAYETAGNANWDAQPAEIREAWKRFAFVDDTPPLPPSIPAPPTINTPNHPGIT